MSSKKSSDSAVGYKAVIAEWRKQGLVTLTAPAVAAALGLSAKTVHGLGIPEAGLGQVARYYVDDVEAALRRLASAKADAPKIDTAKAQ